MVPWRCVVRSSTRNVDIVTRTLRAMSVVALPLSFGACTWFTEFKVQPSIKPWESMSQLPGDSLSPPRGQPLHSVPIQGTAAGAYNISYTASIPVIDSFSPVPNPIAVDARSLDNGRKQFQINCATCHGAAGLGNGPTTKYGMAGIGLTSAVTVARTDGYIYGMIRNGRGLMPSYARIEELDRWDIVNYVRTLQAGSVAGAAKPDTSPAGYPGQNGTSVPGPSQTAPTRPSAYVHPVVGLTRGSTGVNSATAPSKNEGNGVRALHGAPHSEKGAAGETTRGGSPPPESKEKKP
jgi:mono/diheme cytochrome c family protein